MVSRADPRASTLAPVSLLQSLTVVLVLTTLHAGARAQDGSVSISERGVITSSVDPRQFPSSSVLQGSTTAAISLSSEDLSSSIDAIPWEIFGSTTQHFDSSGIVDRSADASVGLSSTMGASSPPLSLSDFLIDTSSPSLVETPSPSLVETPSLSIVETPSLSIVEIPSPSFVEILSPSLMETPSPFLVETPSPSLVESPSPSLVESPSPSLVESLSPSLVESPSPSLVESPSPSLVESPSPSLVENPSPSLVESPSPSLAESPSLSLVESPSLSLVESPSPSLVESPSPSLAETPSPSLVETPSPSLVESPSLSLVEIPSPSLVESPSPSLAETPSPSLVESPSPSLMENPSPSLVDALSPSLVLESVTSAFEHVLSSIKVELDSMSSTLDSSSEISSVTSAGLSPSSLISLQVMPTPTQNPADLVSTTTAYSAKGSEALSTRTSENLFSVFEDSSVAGDELKSSMGMYVTDSLLSTETLSEFVSSSHTLTVELENKASDSPDISDIPMGSTATIQDSPSGTADQSVMALSRQSDTTLVVASVQTPQTQETSILTRSSQGVTDSGQGLSSSRVQTSGTLMDLSEFTDSALPSYSTENMVLSSSSVEMQSSNFYQESTSFGSDTIETLIQEKSSEETSVVFTLLSPRFSGSSSRIYVSTADNGILPTATSDASAATESPMSSEIYLSSPSLEASSQIFSDITTHAGVSLSPSFLDQTSSDGEKAFSNESTMRFSAATRTTATEFSALSRPESHGGSIGVISPSVSEEIPSPTSTFLWPGELPSPLLSSTEQVTGGVSGTISVIVDSIHVTTEGFAAVTSMEVTSSEFAQSKPSISVTDSTFDTMMAASLSHQSEVSVMGVSSTPVISSVTFSSVAVQENESDITSFRSSIAPGFPSSVSVTDSLSAGPLLSESSVGMTETVQSSESSTYFTSGPTDTVETMQMSSDLKSASTFSSEIVPLKSTPVSTEVISLSTSEITGFQSIDISIDTSQDVSGITVSPTVPFSEGSSKMMLTNTISSSYDSEQYSTEMSSSLSVGVSQSEELTVSPSAILSSLPVSSSPGVPYTDSIYMASSYANSGGGVVSSLSDSSQTWPYVPSKTTAVSLSVSLPGVSSVPDTVSLDLDYMTVSTNGLYFSDMDTSATAEISTEVFHTDLNPSSTVHSSEDVATDFSFHTSPLPSAVTLSESVASQAGYTPTTSFSDVLTSDMGVKSLRTDITAFSSETVSQVIPTSDMALPESSSGVLKTRTQSSYIAPAQSMSEIYATALATESMASTKTTSFMDTSLLETMFLSSQSLDVSSSSDIFTDLTEMLSESFVQTVSSFTVSNFVQSSQVMSMYSESVYPSSDGVVSILPQTTITVPTVSDSAPLPESGHSTITLSMQSSETYSGTSRLSSDLLSSSLPQVSHSLNLFSTYLSHSEEALSTLYNVPSLSLMSDSVLSSQVPPTSVPSLSLISDSVLSSQVPPTSVPSLALSSHLDFSSVSVVTWSPSSQSQLVSTETPSSAIVPTETVLPSSRQSDTSVGFSSSDEMFHPSETVPSWFLSSGAQTEMLSSLSESLFSETTSASLETFSSFIEVQSSFIEVSSTAPELSVLFSPDVPSSMDTSQILSTIAESSFLTTIIFSASPEISSVVPSFETTSLLETTVDTTVPYPESSAVSSYSSTFPPISEMQTPSADILVSEISSAMSSLESGTTSLLLMSSSFSEELLPSQTAVFSSPPSVVSSVFTSSEFLSLQTSEPLETQLFSSVPLQDTQSLMTEILTTLPMQSSQVSSANVNEILSTASFQSQNSTAAEIASILLTQTLESMITTIQKSSVSLINTTPLSSEPLFTTVPQISESLITTIPLSSESLITIPPLSSESLITTILQSSESPITTAPLSSESLMTTIPQSSESLITTAPLSSASLITTIPQSSESLITTAPLSSESLISTIPQSSESPITTAPLSSESLITTILQSSESPITTAPQNSESLITTVPQSLQSVTSGLISTVSQQSLTVMTSEAATVEPSQSFLSLTELITSEISESSSLTVSAVSFTDFVEPSSILILSPSMSVTPTSQSLTVTATLTDLVTSEAASAGVSSQYNSSPQVSVSQTLSIISPSSVGVTTLFSSIEIVVPPTSQTTTGVIVSSTTQTTTPEATTIATEITQIVSNTSPVPSIISSSVVDSSRVSSDTAGVIDTATTSVSELFTSIVLSTGMIESSMEETSSLGTTDIMTSLMSSSDVMQTSNSVNILSSEVLPTSSLSSSSSFSTTTTDVIVGPSSPIMPTSSLSSDLISSSTSRLPDVSTITVTSTSSATPDATSVPTTPTVASTTQAPANVSTDLLVVTVIRLQSQDDIQSTVFIQNMEEGLARAYDVAFQRQQSGGLSPSRKKRFAAMLNLIALSDVRVQRAKRAVVNDVEVKITDVTTAADNPSNAELKYTVKDKGQTIPATQAAAALDNVMDQELALELNRVVITKAKAAGQTTQPVTEADDKQLWIIGAVVGPVLLLAVLWVAVCLLVRHKAGKKDKLHIDNQAHLLTVKQGAPNRESEVADDPEYAQATPGQSNGGTLKSSMHKMKYEVNPDPDITVTSAGKDSMASSGPAKKGRKLPKKKASIPNGEVEGDNSSEKVSEKSSAARKKSNKKSSFRETEEMEMSRMDPGFFNSATLQATHQMYAQQTFEEEDEDLLENMEEERRKNKHRQRLKKKQNGSVAQLPPADPTQAAYEKAQQEIDRVLGPRQSNRGAMPGVIVGDKDRRRSKRRSQRGQLNEGYRDENELSAPSGPAPGIPPSESLEEMKHRVHVLLDDAFSLISNSFSSIGNRVAPANTKDTNMEATTVSEAERPHLAQSPPKGNMPEVEKIRSTSMAPKPGEKLHTPILVDRTHDAYDTDGLITWSPYRAADESARIVLPEKQLPSTKAATQEKLQTTTFMESATASGSAPPNYYATQPGQPIVIRTRHLTETPIQMKTDTQPSTTEKSQELSVAADTGSSYVPYPGLQTYEEMLNTTTAHFTASPNTSSGESLMDKPALSGAHNDAVREPDPPAHKPPSRDVGTKDERDFIASSLGNGTSPKELVESLRQELKSISNKMSEAKEPNGVQSSGHRESSTKPTKKPRKTSYLDS